MKKRIQATHLGLALLLAAAQAGAADKAPADPRAAALSQTLLQALADSNGVAGMGAAVWHDGQLMWQGSAGWRDLERSLPVDTHTVFRLASVSKVITATAAARLWQAQRLDVDAPVATLLPWLDSPWPALTTRQLAAHTSGLPHYQAVDNSLGTRHHASARDAVGNFNRRSLLFAPGTQYRYSSWGYTLLSAVVEQQAGVHFLDYLKTDITPGLEVGADGTPMPNTHASKLYRHRNGQLTQAAQDDFSYTWGGGGLAATPEALARWGGRLLQGQVVSASTLDWMLKPAELASGAPVKERNADVGFGWRTETTEDGDRIAHHAGATTGARSALVLWRERQVAAALLSNTVWTSSIERSTQMLAAPFLPPPQGLLSAACPLKATRFEGTVGTQAISGTATFALREGRCTGQLLLDKAVASFDNGLPVKEPRQMQIVGMAADGGLSRAGLVLPVGIFDLRALAGGDFSAQLFGGRSLRLVFSPPRAGPV
jgi:serine beta-lactamase-like protein LACTB, mitochondrial